MNLASCLAFNVQTHGTQMPPHQRPWSTQSSVREHDRTCYYCTIHLAKFYFCKSKQQTGEGFLLKPWHLLIFWLWNTQSSNISRDKGIQKSEHTGLIILSVGGRRKVWGQNQRNNVLIYSFERLVHHSAKKHAEHIVCVRHCARCSACSGERQTAALSSSDLHCVLILKQ